MQPNTAQPNATHPNAVQPALTVARHALALGHISLMRLRSDERAEGVISMAIAVLIIAFLGVAMWIGFNSIWGQAETQIQDNVTQIGS